MTERKPQRRRGVNNLPVSGRTHVQEMRERYRREGRVFPPQPWHLGRHEYEVAKQRDEKERAERANRGLRGVVRRWLEDTDHA